MFYHVSTCNIEFRYYFTSIFLLQISLEHEVLLHPQYFGPQLLEKVKTKLYTEVEGTCSGKLVQIIIITN